MEWPFSMLRCAQCDAGVGADLSCVGATRHRFRHERGFIDFLGDAQRPSSAVEVTDFYRRFPFPGYSPTDDASSLLARSRRSPFMVSLDESLPLDARILDAGCGTGQVSAFLSLSAPRRKVLALDACDASLAAATAFRDRVGIGNLCYLRGDLFQLPVLAGVFDFVISRGVVHHTDDPALATRLIAARVAPGGYLLLGFYESIARIPHRVRRGLCRLAGRPVRVLDPVLRRRDFTEEKKQLWIEDQYRHPLERRLALPAVLADLEEQGFEYVRSVPPAVQGGRLFHGTERPGKLGFLSRRLGWAASGLNDPDAGLVCLVVRRPV